MHFIQVHYPISITVIPINQQLLDYQSQNVQGRYFFIKRQKKKKATVRNSVTTVQTDARQESIHHNCLHLKKI